MYIHTCTYTHVNAHTHTYTHMHIHALQYTYTLSYRRFYVLRYRLPRPNGQTDHYADRSTKGQSDTLVPDSPDVRISRSSEQGRRHLLLVLDRGNAQGQPEVTL